MSCIASKETAVWVKLAFVFVDRRVYQKKDVTLNSGYE